MGDARVAEESDDNDFRMTNGAQNYSGIVLWDLDSCNFSLPQSSLLDVTRNQLPRLAHELAVPQPYRNLRVEVYTTKLHGIRNGSGPQRSAEEEKKGKKGAKKETALSGGVRTIQRQFKKETLPLAIICVMSMIAILYVYSFRFF